MSHELSKRDIQFGLSQAWHGLTTIVEQITAITAEGMLYPMEALPLFVDVVTGQDAEGNDIVAKIPCNAKQIVSLDDNLPIGKPVGLDYTLLSNVAIFEAMEKALEGTQHTLVSAGTCRERSLAWVSIQLAESFKDSRGNETTPLFNLQWGHGGNLAVFGIDSIVQIVCANTYRASLRGGYALKMKHTKFANTLDLTEAIESHIGVSAEFANAMQKAESELVTGTEAREVFAGFAHRGQNVPQEFSKTGSTRLGNYVDRLDDLFHHGRGNIGASRYDLFNAVTDYYTHESAGTDNLQKQFTSSEFGSGAQRKSEFFQVVSDDSRFADTRAHGEKVLLALN